MRLRGGVMALVIAPALVVVSALTVSGQYFMSRYDIGESDFIPPPRIIRPSTDTVDLRGLDRLEFAWSPHEGDPIQREYYDLRIYRGPQAYASSRIYKVRLPPRQWSVYVDAALFEDRQTYTCALRQVYTGSAKSRRSFMTFVTIKR